MKKQLWLLIIAITFGVEGNAQRPKNRLAFCNTAAVSNRNSLMLRISTDEGKTWKSNYLVDSGTPGTKGDFTAYSDLVKIGKNEAGVLYEQDNYRKIIFTPIRIKP